MLRELLPVAGWGGVGLIPCGCIACYLFCFVWREVLPLIAEAGGMGLCCILYKGDFVRGYARGEDVARGCFTLSLCLFVLGGGCNVAYKDTFTSTSTPLKTHYGN